MPRTQVRQTWITLGIGVLIGMSLGSIFNLNRQAAETAECDCAAPVTPETTELFMTEYDGIIGNSKLQQNDPRLLNYIRKFYLIPPPSARPNMKNSSEFASEIRQIFTKKKNGGFFIEAGANDEELLSHTLQLERKYHWTGLLIVPNPFMLTKLVLKNRKAWVANACLSVEGYPREVRLIHRSQKDQEIEESTNGMGIIEQSVSPVPSQTQRDPQKDVYAGPVDCFPLYSLLLALNQTVVDYFSMNLGGMELRVLKTVPFHLLIIKVLFIESNLIPEGRGVLKDFLNTKGYRSIFEKKGMDSFFVHEDFVHEFNITLEKSFTKTKH